MKIFWVCRSNRNSCSDVDVSRLVSSILWIQFLGNWAKCNSSNEVLNNWRVTVHFLSVFHYLKLMCKTYSEIIESIDISSVKWLNTAAKFWLTFFQRVFRQASLFRFIDCRLYFMLHWFYKLLTTSSTLFFT